MTRLALQRTVAVAVYDSPAELLVWPVQCCDSLGGAKQGGSGGGRRPLISTVNQEAELGRGSSGGHPLHSCNQAARADSQLGWLPGRQAGSKTDRQAVGKTNIIKLDNKTFRSLE